MSQVHIITVFLIVFLVGVVISGHRLYPVLRVAFERPLPRIMAIGLVLLALWIAVYFASLLGAYYLHINFGPYYSDYLAGAAAAIPWIVWFLCVLWMQKPYGERKDQ